MIVGGLIESAALALHLEVHLRGAGAKHIAAFDKTSTYAVRTGAARTERVRGLAVGVPDSLMAGTAGRGPRHHGYQHDHHSMRSFRPICRAPCLSVLYCGISDVNWRGLESLNVVLR